MDPATSDSAALAGRLSNGFRTLLRLSYAADHRLRNFARAGCLATNAVALLPQHSVYSRLDPITDKTHYPAWIELIIVLGALCW